MNFSRPFIERPIGTTLLAIGLLLLGIVAYRFLPVASLPSVDFPTIRVNASLPGADPETMAARVAAPLERRLGEIAGVNELTSVNSLGSTQDHHPVRRSAATSRARRRTCRPPSTPPQPTCRPTCPRCRASASRTPRPHPS